MKKLIASLLLAAMLLTSFAACSEKPADDDAKDNDVQVEDAGNEADTESDTEPVETEITPDVPAKDMEGKVFTALTPDWWDYDPLGIHDLVVEETTGDAFNDAIYDRNAYMTEKYNCTLTQEEIDCGTIVQVLGRANQADDGAYDFCFVRGQQLATVMSGGLLQDLDSIPHTNYDNPWWNKDSYDSMAVAGHHLAVASDVSIIDENTTWIMVFNKGLIKELQLDNPYDLVKNGTWTYDKLFTMAEAAKYDMDGDGAVSNNDRFGLTHTRETTFAMWASSGIRLANNVGGTIEWTYRDEVSVTKMVALLEKLYDQSVCFNVHQRGDAPLGGHFKNNLSLFEMTGVYALPNMRDMDADFGLLPFPKYDEAQERYLTSTSGLFISVLGVPQCSPDPDSLGIFLEEFAYYGHKNINPIFYETLLERKVMRDEESIEMINYIFDNVTYDFGNVLNLSNTSEDLIWLTQEYNSDIASFIAGRLTREDTEVQKLLEAIDKNYNS